MLYTSGYIDAADVSLSVAAGADFLQKPFTPVVLGRKVREVLDRPGVGRDCVRRCSGESA